MQSVLSFSKCKYVCKECGSSNEWTNSLVEVIIIVWISSICMLVGYLYLKNSDIINKHR